MAAKQHILFHLFMAMVAVILLKTTVAYEHHPEHEGPPSEHRHHNHSAAANNTDDGERKFRWPSSVRITIHREGKVDGPAGEPMRLNEPANSHPNAPENNSGDGKRKIPFQFPFPIRASHVGSDGVQNIGTNGSINASGVDNDGERKIHYPSSATLTIHRSGRVDSDGAQYMGPNGIYNHPHNAPGNDTDGERKFHWPSSMSITINRAGQAIHHDPKLPEVYKLDQEKRLYGFGPVLVSCNHTTQAGRTCADCTHSLLCLSNNLGVKRDCGPQYCDDGRCSPQPSANCNATSNA